MGSGVRALVRGHDKPEGLERSQCTVFTWAEPGIRITRAVDAAGAAIPADVGASLIETALSELAGLDRDLFSRETGGHLGFIIATGEAASRRLTEAYVGLAQGCESFRREELLVEALGIARRTGIAGLPEAVEAVAAPCAKPGHASLRLSLCDGTLEVEGGRTISLTKRELDVLTALALSRDGLSLDALADLLWPDGERERSRATFKVHVHRLRVKAGSKKLIVLAHSRWSLGAGVEVDLRRWEQMTKCTPGVPLGTAGWAALTDAHDRLLRSITSPRCSSLSSQLERATEGVLRRVTLCLIEDAFARRDYQNVLAVASDLSTLDPYEVTWQESIIRAYLLLGNTGAAGKQVQKYAATLRDELGTDLPTRIKDLLDPTFRARIASLSA